MNCKYLIEKISNSNIIEEPFPHIIINNFLSEKHFNILKNDEQIHFEEVKNNDELYNKLLSKDWKIQRFPGCITKWSEYKEYLNNTKIFKSKSNNPVGNVGMTFRLSKYNNKDVEDLINFMNSESFHNILKNKFNVKNKTTIISVIQKNLTNYEISPHPDTRNKALTYLLNINKNDEIENLDCHTHLLKLKKEYEFIANFWDKNENIDRSWLPWNFCNTVKKINKNNTLVIFKPNSNPPSLHAIKLNYDHLKFQRTQIYGNLMFEKKKEYKLINYKDIL